jgi:hypothetical protein
MLTLEPGIFTVFGIDQDEAAVYPAAQRDTVERETEMGAGDTKGSIGATVGLLVSGYPLLLFRRPGGAFLSSRRAAEWARNGSHVLDHVCYSTTNYN